jgi:hypothetical protein
MTDIDQRELFENSYYYFVEALAVLAAPPAQACELLGYFNVAFEAKFDAEAGRYLFNYERCTLSEKNKNEILELINLLQSIPDQIISFTKNPGESLERMHHPCWILVRQKAAALLSELAPITEQNRRYFNV